MCVFFGIGCLEVLPDENDEIIVAETVAFRKDIFFSYKFFKRVWKRFKHYRGIYITAIIHCADVITDYLVLTQYIFFAYDELANDENKENINYLFVAIASFLAIVLSRLLSCYYIWIFTTNKWDLFLNLFDLYIFKEIIASHETGNKTDLMQFLQVYEYVFCFRLLFCFLTNRRKDIFFCTVLNWICAKMDRKLKRYLKVGLNSLSRHL